MCSVHPNPNPIYLLKTCKQQTKELETLLTVQWSLEPKNTASLLIHCLCAHALRPSVFFMSSCIETLLVCPDFNMSGVEIHKKNPTRQMLLTVEKMWLGVSEQRNGMFTWAAVVLIIPVVFSILLLLFCSGKSLIACKCNMLHLLFLSCYLLLPQFLVLEHNFFQQKMWSKLTFQVSFFLPFLRKGKISQILNMFMWSHWIGFWVLKE